MHVFRTFSTRTLRAAATTAARRAAPKTGAPTASTMAGRATSSRLFASSLSRGVAAAGSLSILSLSLAFAQSEQSVCLEAAAAAAAAAAATSDTMYESMDTVYNTGNYERTLELLEEEFKEDEKKHFEWLWRRARSLYGIATRDKTDKKIKESMVNEAFELIGEASKQEHNNNNVHRWYGILLNEFNTQKGTKQKIKHLPDVKKSWEEAVRLDPKDATAYHLLGRWSYGLMEINWASKQIAYALFGALPKTSYEEAYNFFLQAENIQPGFWLNNKLQLAQVCMRMGKNEEAKNHLLSALDIAEVTEEDKVSMKKVKKHLDYYKWWPVDGEEEKK